MEYVQLSFLNKERSSEIKALASVSVEVVFVVKRDALNIRGVVNRGLQSQQFFVGVRKDFDISLDTFWGGFDLIFPNN